MTSSHAVAMAARHGRRSLKISSPSMILPVASRLGNGSSGCSVATAAPSKVPASAITKIGSSRFSSTRAAAHDQNSLAGNGSLALIAAAASLTMATASASCASCESSRDDSDKVTAGLADESEEGNGENITVQDGMDAGGSATSKSSPDNESRGPAEADEDNAQSNTAEEDDDEDPSKDEDTSCSICLINRQGPCRKFWLKFERCMKEHSAEKDKAERETKAKEEEAAAAETEEAESESSEEESAKELTTSGDDEACVEDAKKSREEEWDSFMLKTIQPGEDDDDDDDDDEDEEDDEDEDEENEEKESADTNSEDESAPQKEEEPTQSLAERCDKFMIPWISCIQQHRNVYSLISNAFYQKDYIDPLEDTVADSKRMCFMKNNAEIGEECGYVMKFHGVEIDLGNWREHVEADADDGNDFEEEATPAPPMDEPHLINAYAKFRLTDPSTGQPIEVAYIKDQKGRLLGFDSFTKRDSGAGNSEESDGEESGADGQEKTAAATVSENGECTFHIVPGETTSIAAFAIYRGEKKDDEEGNAVREDFLYCTPDVPLPGAANQKRQ